MSSPRQCTTYPRLVPQIHWHPLLAPFWPNAKQQYQLLLKVYWLQQPWNSKRNSRAIRLGIFITTIVKTSTQSGFQFCVKSNQAFWFWFYDTQLKTALTCQANYFIFVIIRISNINKIMFWGAVIAYCKHFGSMILLRNAVTTTIAAQMQI